MLAYFCCIIALREEYVYPYLCSGGCGAACGVGGGGCRRGVDAPAGLCGHCSAIIPSEKTVALNTKQVLDTSKLTVTITVNIL